MGIVFRQSVVATVVTFLGAVLGAAFNFLSAIVLTKQFLGLTRNLINTGAVLQLVLLGGTAALLQTYVRRWPLGDPRRSALFTACMFVPIVIMGLFLIPYYGFKDQIAQLYQAADVPLILRYYSVLPVLALLFSYVTLLDAYLVAHTRVSISAFNREVLLRLLNLLVLGLYYFDLVSFSIFVFLIALAYLVPVVIMLYYALRTEPLHFRSPIRTFDKEEKKELSHFALFHLLAAVSGSIIGYIDSLMLAPLAQTGFNALAVYSIAVFVVSVAVIPYKAMTAAAFSSLSEAYLAKDGRRLQNLYHRITTNMLIATCGIVTIIWCNMDNAVSLLPPGYGAVKQLVYILLIGRVLDVGTGMNNDLIGISKYYRFGFYSAGMLLVLIITLNRILIPAYGYYGAAWSAALALSIINIVKMIYLRFRMGISPLTGRSLSVLLPTVTAIIIGGLIPFAYNVIVDVVLRTMVTAVIFASGILWLKPSDDVDAVLQAIKSRIKRVNA